MRTLTLVKTQMDDDDHALMRRVALKDMAAYRMLIDRHGERCLRIATRIMGRREDAEDVVQEAWLKLWHEAPYWQPRAQLSTWLFRVLTNLCIDEQRKVKRLQHGDMELFVDERIAVDEDLIASQRGRHVALAVASLKHQHRTVLVMSYYEGMETAEIAEIMGLKPGALQVLLHRARKELKKKLGS